MRGGYWLGGLLVVAALLGAAAFLVTRLLDLDETIAGFPKAPLAGGAVELQARDYAVYLDVPAGTGEFPWTLSIRAPDGAEARLRPSGASFEYDLGGREGSRIGSVGVPAAGVYEVTGSGPPGARVVFGRGLAGELLTTVLGTLGILAGAGAAGVLVIVLTAARRRPREPRRWP